MKKPKVSGSRTCSSRPCRTMPPIVWNGSVGACLRSRAASLEIIGLHSQQMVRRAAALQ